MISWILLLRHLMLVLKTIKKIWDTDTEFKALVWLLFTIFASGTAFYRLVEEWSIVDSLYFCFATISTIGYGDLTPSTDISKIFTMILALCGIGTFVGIVTKLAVGLTNSRIKKIDRFKNRRKKDFDTKKN